MPIYSNYSNKAVGYAGQVARGDQSLSRAWAMQNAEETAVIPTGIFVTRGESVNSAKLIKAASDKIAGVVVTSGVFKEVQPGEQASVMHIGHGDSVWVQCDSENMPEVNDQVKILMTGAKAGLVAKTGTKATQFYVVRVSKDLVEIAREEVA